MSPAQMPESSSASPFRQSSWQYPATRAPALQNSPAQAQSTPPEPRCQYSQTHTRCAVEPGLRSSGTEISLCTSPNPHPPDNRFCSLFRIDIVRVTFLLLRFVLHSSQLF